MSEDELEAFMPPRMAIHRIIAVAGGLVLPLILVPVVALTGYSEVVEELAKALIIGTVILALPSVSGRLFWAAVFALMFGLSENVLYLGYFTELGDFGPWLLRFVTTVPMHILAALAVAAAGSIRKWLLPLGLVLAVTLHLAFNQFVLTWF